MHSVIEQRKEEEDENADEDPFEIEQRQSVRLVPATTTPITPTHYHMPKMS